MNKKNIKVAIDGPSAVGKSTISKLVAHDLGYAYIDTGALYRAITWKVLQNNIDINNEDLILDLVSKIQIAIKKKKNDFEEHYHLFIDGEDVTEEIRNPKIDQNVSEIAMLPKIRKKLIYLQRDLAKSGNIVMEGRDIGSIILPNADLKFYLTASEEERVRRRYQELRNKGYKISREKVKEQMAKRDLIDSNRKYAPLVKANDAIQIESTNKTIEEVKNEILDIIKRYKKSGESQIENNIVR